MALLRPSELARVWQLSPKTVYTWIKEGRLPAIQTPGAQYRVRSDDARAYCAEHGLPLPRELRAPGGAVAVFGKATPSSRLIARACKARGAETTSWSSALDGLLGVAVDPPDVVAIDANGEDVKLLDLLRALRKPEKLVDVKLVVYDAPARAPGLTAVSKAADGLFAKGAVEDAAKAICDFATARRDRG